MSVDKQQTWAEAVVECVEDAAERTRLLQLYEPDEMAAALLRQVAIANALRSSLSCCEEERRLQAEEVRKLRAEVERLKAHDAEWTQKAATWLASPEAAQRLDGYRELAGKCAALEAEVERLRESADTAIGYLKDIGDWAHGRSAGPTVHDDMWTVRRMAYEGMDAAAIDAAREEK